MLYEDLRTIHEDIERLEQAVADRLLDDPKHIRSRLIRDHEISNFLSRIQSQSERALQLYNDEQDARMQEVQSLSTGDTYATFYDEYNKVKDFHKRYPNEPVENLERAYKKAEDGGPPKGFAGDIDTMFAGEEAFGRFFDLTMLHEEYLNLPGVKEGKRPTYMQYLDCFDAFTPPKCTIGKKEKMTDEYFSYVGSLAQYLESFLRRIKPLEDLDKLFKGFDDEFEKDWQEDKVPGWEPQRVLANGTANGPATEGTGEGVWCADCQKEFKNDNVYKAHLTGKKHIKNAEARQQKGDSGDVEMTNGQANGGSGPTVVARLKERAVAEREHRVRKLAGVMQTEREDTRVNVERKAGMTDRERQQELEALYAEDQDVAGIAGGEDGEDDDEKIYNPLKLPLAWDGKPIPFWLYKLHGLGVEFHCEICGNYVYMGRRAFDKHFSEQRHIYGLQCLGISKSTGLFREITKIDEAQKLWEKLERDRAKELERKGGENGEGVVEMEDYSGNVMPRRVWQDLEKAGLL